MKYIIVAKDEHAGTSKDDVLSPHLVTEIATELIITRLALFDMLQLGKISISDTIVTRNERKCLYTNVFSNVISWQKFNSLSLDTTDQCIDLVQPDEFYKLAVGENISARTKDELYTHINLPYFPFYKNFDRDKKYITNFSRSSLENYNTSYPFVAINIRRRGAWADQKNLSDRFWQKLNQRLYKSNINAFVFGFETKQFTKDHIQYVENFQDWCTLLEHKNCRHIVSTPSGAVYPAMLFGTGTPQITIIDLKDCIAEHTNDPSFYGDCVNFTNVKFDIIESQSIIDNQLEDIIYEKLTKKL